MRSSKKGQITMQLVMGIAGLVLLLVIALLVVSTILGAGLFERTTGTINITDEGKGLAIASEINLNGTGYQLGNETFNASRTSYTIHSALNCSAAVCAPVGSGNWSINGSGLVTNTSVAGNTSYNNMTYNYSFKYTEPRGAGENAGFNMSDNLLAGVRNVNTKIPTILLIAAIVILFSVLAILVIRAKQSNMGAGANASL